MLELLSTAVNCILFSNLLLTVEWDILLPTHSSLSAETLHPPPLRWWLSMIQSNCNVTESLASLHLGDFSHNVTKYDFQSQVAAVVVAAGGEADETQLALLFTNLEGKDIHELLAKGEVDLKNCSSGGGGGGGAAAAPAGIQTYWICISFLWWMRCSPSQRNTLDYLQYPWIGCTSLNRMFDNDGGRKQEAASYCSNE